jgi:uncharacterized protein YebE (UPF0316 family)
MPWLALLIFVAETSVVTTGTVRTIFIAKGMKKLAAFLGLIEVSIWLFAISQIMQNLSSAACFAAYAAGFVTGNYLGVTIEERLAIGCQVVRIITRGRAAALLDSLRALNFGVTRMDAQGATGPVDIIFTIVPRKQLGQVVELIRLYDPKTFFTIEDVRTATQGVFPRAVRARTLVPGLGRRPAA